MRRRNFMLTFYSMLLDAGIIFASFAAAYWLRFDVLILDMPGLVPSYAAYIRMTVFVLILWLATFKILGVYDKKYSSLIDEGSLVAGSVALGGLIFFSLLYVYREYWFSRQVLMYSAMSTLVLMLLWRGVFIYAGRLAHRKGFGLARVLIIGTGDIAKLLSSKIVSDPGLGYRVVGMLEAQDNSLSNLSRILKEQNIDEVIIADPNLSSDKVLDIITETESCRVEFKIVPGLLEIMASRIDIGEIAGVPLVSIAEIQWQGPKAWLKRSVDIILSFILLVILAPLFLLVAILIKLDSSGPIFFSQKRVGQNGRIFNFYKFRSMVQNAEGLLDDIKHLSEVDGHIFKIKNDPRLTRVGRIIRRLSIDELPQLFNVFIGDMSLVGPRPPLPNEVSEYNAWHKKRLRIAPGITGLWQVSGRSEIPFEDMVRLDIFYIENWSLWQDFKILLRTIPAVLFAKGAY